MRCRATRLPTAAVAAAGALAACGGSDEARGGAEPQLTVSAAASLSRPLEACARAFPGARVRLSFGGSDELAAQIRRGVRPDLFAAANTTLPDQLAAEGLLRDPVVFATNALVLATPAGGAVRGLDDLGGGRRVVIGAEGVPVGDYARAVLDRLPARRRRAVLAGVRSEEPDVRGIVAKLAQRAADAGFVYASDVRGAGRRLRAIPLPAALRPQVRYGAGVVAGAPQPGPAARLLEDLRSGRCARALRAAGFGAP